MEKKLNFIGRKDKKNVVKLISFIYIDFQDIIFVTIFSFYNLLKWLIARKLWTILSYKPINFYFHYLNKL